MRAVEGACAALLIAWAVGATSCAAPPEAVGKSVERIIGGDADVSDLAVVALKRISTGTLCSGTLVAPGAVLTAAHCVYGVSAGDLEVLVGDDASSPTQTVAASSVATYPSYTGESSGLAGGVDLGVVLLAQPLSMAPVALDTTSTDAELEGATVTLVGFGVSSTIDQTQVGVRRSVSAPIGAVCSRLLTLGTADANVCFGDSGGAVLLGGKLVAVISSGSPDCIAPSSQTRLSAHATWLANVLAGDASASCPTCVEPDPSCGASTETAPASSNEAGVSDASAANPGSHGGCATAPGEGAPEEAVVLAVSCLLVLRRRVARRGAALSL